MAQFILSSFRGHLTNNATKISFKTSLLRPLLLNNNFSTTTPNNNSIQNITVYGSGLMGAGIVQVAAQNGFKVTMVDIEQAFIEKGKKIIDASLSRIAKKQFKDDENSQKSFIETTWSNIKTETNSEKDKISKPNTIFASNTSSLPISEISKITERQDKFAGLHFFNPVPQMKLVEIIKNDQTSEDTYQKLVDMDATFWFFGHRILTAWTYRISVRKWPWFFHIFRQEISSDLKAGILDNGKFQKKEFKTF
uniref:3-hydroxyacyl-CoA dehydrogenase NAD binding domain-containing protein n=1 Tax=Rhizophagus irregularis (strain DAOM 181602 / DAOM 197198 / MUCL 43194) TaxID=747089 RepID=U9UCZ0_RHIID